MSVRNIEQITKIPKSTVFDYLHKNSSVFRYCSLVILPDFERFWVYMRNDVGLLNQFAPFVNTVYRLWNDLCLIEFYLPCQSVDYIQQHEAVLHVLKVGEIVKYFDASLD